MQYKKHIRSFVIVISGVCYYCGLFVSLSSLVVVLRSNLGVAITLDKDATNMAFFNHYGWEIDRY